MADRIITGTLDTFSVDSGSDVTYKGAGEGNNTGLSQRAFEVNPGSTGDITFTLDRSAGVISLEIFQDDDHSAGSAPSGYQKAFNVAQAGKGKRGRVAPGGITCGGGERPAESGGRVRARTAT